MEYSDDNFLMISGIQHFIFCPRQWALIHVEQQWADNLSTFEGETLHERVHNPFINEKRGDVITVRALRVFSRTLGISGECDAVEFHKSPNGIPLKKHDGLYYPVPIEYKRGRPKEHNADRLQLVAQAICLEEMLSCEIPIGYLYYGEIKHREEVIIDGDLRMKVIQSFTLMHQYIERGYTPNIRANSKCNNCSVRNLCFVELEKTEDVSDYINSFIEEEK